jgi:hypothetical protein
VRIGIIPDVRDGEVVPRFPGTNVALIEADFLRRAPSAS